MSIDQVIARSRAAGGFGERRRFTVAKGRAIHKIREFALADPYYYILELIQAAVLNGARFVDISTQESSMQLSYFGGLFERAELTQLFDFLFAESGQLETADARALAVGINALLRFEPKRIVLESGDGTLEGSTRVEIHGDASVDVGQPTLPLHGTYLRAEGLKRKKVAGRSESGSEESAIEQRCMAAPVPIMLNDHALFGYRTMRNPVLFRYEQPVEFDEGDLYGTIGRSTEGIGSFRLLNAGVWVQSIDNTFFEDRRVGGIVAFERLRKTADHAGFAQDEVYAQLWHRLLPYVRQLDAGSGVQGTYHVCVLGEREQLGPIELRQRLAGVSCALLLENDWTAFPGERAQLQALAQQNGWLLLVVARIEVATLRELFSGVRMLPLRSGESAVATLAAPPVPEPAGPWWASPIKLHTGSLRAMAEVEQRGVATGFGAELHDGAFDAYVYSPERAQHRDTLWVRLKALGRLLWEGPAQCNHAGLVLELELPMLTLTPLRELLGEPASAAQLLVNQLSTEITRAAEEVRRGLVLTRVLPNSAAAHTLGTALAAQLYVRVTGEAAGAHLELTSSEPGWERYRTAALWTNLRGEGVSVADLERWLEECGGVVYSALEHRAQYEPLRKERILRLDHGQEAALVEMLGRLSCVRLGSFETLAESGPLALRPLLLGLRSYPDAALLCEGDMTELTREARDQHLRALLRQLLQRATERLTTHGARAVLQHLQHAALHPEGSAVFGELSAKLHALPLFAAVGALGTLWLSRDQLLRTYPEQPLLMCDGRAMYDLQGWREAIWSNRGASEPAAAAALVMDGFVLHLLRRGYRVSSVIDDASLIASRPLADAAAAAHEIVRSARVVGNHLSGVVALMRSARPTVVVVDAAHEAQRALVDVAEAFGLSAELRLIQRVDDAAEVRAEVDRALDTFLLRLTEELAVLPADAPDYEPLARTLLRYAGRHVSLSLSPGGSVRVTTYGEATERILSLPLFATKAGLPLAAIHLYQRLRAAPGSDPLALLAPDLPAVLRSWAESNIRPPEPAPTPFAPATTAPESLGTTPGVRSPERDFVERVRSVLARLAPDSTVCGGASTPAIYLLCEHGTPLAGTAPPARFFTEDAAENDQRWTTWCQDLVSDDADWDVTYLHGTGLFLNRQAKLVALAFAQPKQHLPWLLLRIYGLINNLLGEVTNQHELAFQRALRGALHDGLFDPHQSQPLFDARPESRANPGPTNSTPQHN